MESETINLGDYNIIQKNVFFSMPGLVRTCDSCLSSLYGGCGGRNLPSLRCQTTTKKCTLLCNFALIFASFSCDFQPLLLVSFYFRSSRQSIKMMTRARHFLAITFVTMSNDYQKYQKNIHFYAILLQILHHFHATSSHYS